MNVMCECVLDVHAARRRRAAQAARGMEPAIRRLLRRVERTSFLLWRFARTERANAHRLFVGQVERKYALEDNSFLPRLRAPREG